MYYIKVGNPEKKSLEMFIMIVLWIRMDSFTCMQTKFNFILQVPLSFFSFIYLFSREKFPLSSGENFVVVSGVSF